MRKSSLLDMKRLNRIWASQRMVWKVSRLVWSAHYIQLMEGAAKTIQRSWTKYRYRKHAAATAIQSAFRGHFERLMLRYRRREDALRRAQEAAAQKQVLIQEYKRKRALVSNISLWFALAKAAVWSLRAKFAVQYRHTAEAVFMKSRVCVLRGALGLITLT